MIGEANEEIMVEFGTPAFGALVSRVRTGIEIRLIEDVVHADLDLAFVSQHLECCRGVAQTTMAVHIARQPSMVEIIGNLARQGEFAEPHP